MGRSSHLGSQYHLAEQLHQEWNDTIKTIINDLHKDGTLKKISLKWIGSDITTQ